MNASLALAWCVTLGIAGTAIAYTVSNYVTAHSDAERAATEHAFVTTSLRDLAELRAGGGAVGMQASTDEGLAESVSQALAEIGMPPTALESLSPDLGPSAGPPVGGGGSEHSGISLRRAKVSLALQDVTLPKLGAFIDSFSRRRPGWRLVNIDIARDRDARVTPGEDLPLRAVLLLETLIVAELGDPHR